MADAKISALTNLTAADPTNDMIPIVDASDTPPASGNTKRISINNLLACSPSATLASATITGDLTVDTSTLKVDSANDRVGIGQATPAYKLHVQGNAGSQLVLQSNNTDATAKEGTVSARHYTNAEEPISTVGGYATSTNNYVYLGGGFSGGNAATFLGFHTATNNTTVNGTERYSIDSTGISTWSVAGTTAMTLNSTGLGIGDAPAANSRLTIGSTNATGFQYALRTTGITTGRSQIYLNNTSGDLVAGIEGSTAGASVTGSAAYSAYIGTATSNPFYLVTGGSVRATVDTAGNCGIGVTPSTAWNTGTNLQVGVQAALYSNSALGAVDLSSNSVRTGNDTYQYFLAGSNQASRFQQRDAAFRWFSAAAGTSPNAITFGDAKMTLDASGNLLVGQTSVGESGIVSIKGGNGIGIEATGSGGSAINAKYSNTGTGYFGYFKYGATLVGTIASTGAGNCTFNQVSDYRLKEDVQPIVGALNRINSLKPSTYKWKINGSVGEGFLAHELALAVPFAVTGEKDAIDKNGEINPQQVDLSKVVPILVAAIQELTARVQTLEAR